MNTEHLQPQRIMIFGNSGSGKSTFALRLHEITGLPLHHLDKYFFRPHWVERDYTEFLAIQEELVDSERWIIDGNCTKSFDMRAKNADLVIYFNLPRALCYWRVFKRRYFEKDPQIDDRAEGCPEVARFVLIKYIWNYRDRVKRFVSTFQDKYPGKRFIEICSDQEAEELLEHFPKLF